MKVMTQWGHNTFIKVGESKNVLLYIYIHTHTHTHTHTTHTHTQWFNYPGLSYLDCKISNK